MLEAAHEYSPLELAKIWYAEYCTYMQMYTEEETLLWEALPLQKRLAIERTAQNFLKALAPSIIVPSDHPNTISNLGVAFR